MNTCDETCNIEEISGTVTLHSNGIDSGCDLEQCCMYFGRRGKVFSKVWFDCLAPIGREYILIPKDVDSNQPPKSLYTTFDGVTQGSIVEKADFSGQLNNDFTIHMWMKHSISDTDEKEHIFCKSDEKCKKKFWHFFVLKLEFSSSQKSSSCGVIRSTECIKTINT